MSKRKKCSECGVPFTPAKSYYHRCNECQFATSYEEGKEEDHTYGFDGYR